jgi:ubiquitin-conjugating enzyme E2 Z
MSNITIVSKECAKRLVKDIKQLQKEPLEGIFYIHDEKDMLKGNALIIGPPDTPYEGGYYLFKFIFPSDYPFSPPKITYHTNDGVTRMHPNLYKNGKVCLSLLNTWNGDAWTSCQTISSVLLVMRSIMTQGPLKHEPGIDIFHRDFRKYTEIIRYKNIQVAMIDVIQKEVYEKQFGDLIEIARNDFMEHFDTKQNILKSSEETFQESDVHTQSGRVFVSLYNISCNIDYTGLSDLFYEIKDKYTKK